MGLGTMISIVKEKLQLKFILMLPTKIHTKEFLLIGQHSFGH